MLRPRGAGNFNHLYIVICPLYIPENNNLAKYFGARVIPSRMPAFSLACARGWGIMAACPGLMTFLPF